MTQENIESIALDHVAIGVETIADARSFMGEALGGQALGEDSEGSFRSGQWAYAGGGKLELIAPDGPPGGFMHRFIDSRGPGIHHVTFKVKDLPAARRAVEASGLSVVGYDDSYPGWKEMFIHPRQAQGIVVQLAQSQWPARKKHAGGQSVTLVGVRLNAHSELLARQLWGSLLRGQESRDAESLVFRWNNSPLRISVDVDPSAPAGPKFIEISLERPMELPDQAHPTLGARFVVV